MSAEDLLAETTDRLATAEREVEHLRRQLGAEREQLRLVANELTTARLEQHLGVLASDTAPASLIGSDAQRILARLEAVTTFTADRTSLHLPADADPAAWAVAGGAVARLIATHFARGGTDGRT